MSTRDLAQLIGCRAFYRIGALRVAVEILDVRNAYGRLDLHVVPVEGEGSAWVSDANVELVGATPDAAVASKPTKPVDPGD